MFSWDADGGWRVQACLWARGLHFLAAGTVQLRLYPTHLVDQGHVCDVWLRAILDHQRGCSPVHACDVERIYPTPRDKRGKLCAVVPTAGAWGGGMLLSVS